MVKGLVDFQQAPGGFSVCYYSRMISAYKLPE